MIAKSYSHKAFHLLKQYRHSRVTPTSFGRNPNFKMCKILIHYSYRPRKLDIISATMCQRSHFDSSKKGMVAILEWASDRSVQGICFRVCGFDSSWESRKIGYYVLELGCFSKFQYVWNHMQNPSLLRLDASFNTATTPAQDKRQFTWLYEVERLIRRFSRSIWLVIKICNRDFEKGGWPRPHFAVTPK